MALAHKLAMQLRAAEDRINRLERDAALFRERAARADAALFRERAARAEGWLQTIYKEIEENPIAVREGR
jgi:hypothetical protein